MGYVCIFLTLFSIGNHSFLKKLVCCYFISTILNSFNDFSVTLQTKLLLSVPLHNSGHLPCSKPFKSFNFFTLVIA